MLFAHFGVDVAEFSLTGVFFIAKIAIVDNYEHSVFSLGGSFVELKLLFVSVDYRSARPLHFDQDPRFIAAREFKIDWPTSHVSFGRNIYVVRFAKGVCDIT